jgi:hypothetical protein
VFEEALNAKNEVWRLKNELCQAQQDALTIQALKSTKSNFVNMQS